jgi:superfamily II DNA or RNA helicase|uniref:Helicase ATP-binding domain-containing protein n=1 Tax=viral metagenome TaxID=1070528 RepID=A0A6C0CCW6_9ZZZZ
MDIIVKPNEWVLPNRIGYNKNIYNTFNPSKYASEAAAAAAPAACKCSNDTCEIEESYIKLLRQQKIVKDYMQFDSPYRGILLYHELGSGKSIASIAAAEGYVNQKKIVIMTPASLSQNYENELLIASKVGRNLKKTWTQIKVNKKSPEMMKDLTAKYAIADKFVKKNGLAWVPLYKEDIEGAEVVIDKIRYNSSDAKDAKYRAEIDTYINHILRNRYTFINYNGLTEKMIKELGTRPFDNAFIIIDEIHNFISRIVNGSRLAKAVYIHMMNAKGTKIILLSGTPIINQPHEIATLINLVRGPIKEYNIDLLKKSKVPDLNAIIEHLRAKKLYNYIDYIDYNETCMSITLIPEGFKRTDAAAAAAAAATITKDKWTFSQEDLIKNITEVLNKTDLVKLSIKSKVIANEALPTDKVVFNKLFIDDKNITVKNEDLFKRRILGTISYYKTTGSELFPRMLPTVSRELFMTDHQIKKYLEVRSVEIKMDDRKKLFKGKGGAGGGGGDDIGSVYRAFSRMVCNFAFPDEINRVFPNDVRVLMKKELKDMVNVDSDNGDDMDVAEADAAADAAMDAKKLNKEVVAAYGEQLEAAMDRLVEDDYLEIDRLRDAYSPKFAQMYEDINSSPGSVLVYSQFRMIEGLGIFKEVLNRQGYAEINIVNNEEFGYMVDDIDVFDKIYDNKRYVVFNSDRVKTNILMNIFNGNSKALPKVIQEQLKHLNIDKEQMYGKIAKVMMITQSGAEGISLKNVRRVLITEYFWNSVRIDQVIGRAVRTCSHKSLPVEDQTVQVFTYLMNFTKKQLTENLTLRSKDKEVSTDKHIYNIAKSKEGLVNSFLKMLKAASLDCVIQADVNNPLSNGYKCYSWPINVNDDELSYTNNISLDKKILQFKNKQHIRKDRGRVVLKNGKKYVILKDKLYDYYSYVNAGILIPIAGANV